MSLSVHNTYPPRYRPQFSSDLPQIWTRDNEDQARWPIKPEVVNAHARQFNSGLAHFWVCVHDKHSHFSSDFNQIWNVDPFFQVKEQVPSLTQPEFKYDVRF